MSYTDLQRETFQEMFQFVMGEELPAKCVSLDTIPSGQRLIFSVHASEAEMDETIVRFTRKFLGKADAANLAFRREGKDILIWKTTQNPE